METFYLFIVIFLFSGKIPLHISRFCFIMVAVNHKKGVIVVTDIYDILSRLGVVRKYLGRDYLAYSIRITLQNENYFFLVTKCLYPDVASHFNTNWKRVERDIRTAVKAAWKSNRAYLEELACRPLNDPPKPIEFIDIIVTYLIREKAAAPCWKARAE